MIFPLLKGQKDGIGRRLDVLKFWAEAGEETRHCTHLLSSEMKSTSPQRQQQIKPGQNEDISPAVPEKLNQPWGFMCCVKLGSLNGA